MGLATDVWARSATSALESVLKVGKPLPNPVQLPQGNEQEEEHWQRRVARWRENQKGKRKKAENKIDGKVGSPRSCFGDNVLNVRDAHNCINHQRAALRARKSPPPDYFFCKFFKRPDCIVDGVAPSGRGRGTGVVENACLVPLLFKELAQDCFCSLPSEFGRSLNCFFGQSNSGIGSVLVDGLCAKRL